MLEEICCVSDCHLEGKSKFRDTNMLGMNKMKKEEKKKEILEVDISDKAEEKRNTKFGIISLIVGMLGALVSIANSIVEWVIGGEFNVLLLVGDSLLTFVAFTFGMFFIFFVIVRWTVHYHYLNREYCEGDDF